MFRLNFVFEEDSDENDDDDIVRGLNLNIDGEEEDKNCIIGCNKSNEIKENILTNENQGNIIIISEEHREEDYILY